MPLDQPRDALALEECLDELSEFLDTLQRFSPAIIALALRVHLEAALQALIDARECTREEVREFVRGLEREALQYEDT
jgi:wyosine [tRNA(Phe)-imidazoG37] synthetase (radical SAM superfamily)